MKVLYLSSPYYFDMDLCYVQQLKENTDHVFLIDVPSYASESTAFRVKLKSEAGIFPATSYPELAQFSAYLDLKKTFIINRTSKKSYALSNVKLQFKVNQFIQKQNPNLVHANGLLKPNFLWYLKFNQIPRVLTVHDPFPHSGEDGQKVEFIRKLNFKSFRRFIILNDSQKNAFSERLGIPSEHIFTSKLGSYTFLKHYIGEKNEVKNKLKILFFGRISPYKGIEELCKAMSKVCESIPNAELIVAGSGSFDFDIFNYQQSPNFKFINRYISTEELVQLILSSQFVVCPYRDATQSGVIMTAFGLDTPVIATNVGGLKEMVINNFNGLLIEPKNISLLTEAMVTLLENPIQVQTMRENIQKDNKNGLNSWKNITLDLLKYYHSISK